VHSLRGFFALRVAALFSQWTANAARTLLFTASIRELLQRKIGKWENRKLLLRKLHQFHLAVAAAMEHKCVSRGRAEDEQIAVSELGLLDRFFDGHGPERDGLATLDDVRLNNRSLCRKRVNRDGRPRLACEPS
jgi:hypothetical protein